jgi:hypothetical protein
VVSICDIVSLFFVSSSPHHKQSKLTDISLTSGQDAGRQTMSEPNSPNAEVQRLERQRQGIEKWSLWGPYLSERAWGSVREDYSADGDAWNAVSHDRARSHAYRWNEDGLGGLCDERQFLCFALALWNGRDPILKERAFGLTGPQGNHGEDVKEYYFYVDATPSHSYLRYVYKYPQAVFPYQRLVDENARRDRSQPAFGILDSGVFDDGRYWDVEIVYAKAGPEEVHIRITTHNRGPEAAEVHVLPTLWFRNTWSWADGAIKPALREVEPPHGAAWVIEANHPELGTYFLYGRSKAPLLFTENESNGRRLWNDPDAPVHAKDSIHRHVVDGEVGAVKAVPEGTKAASWHRWTVGGGESVTLDLVLAAAPMETPFAHAETVHAARQSEATVFFDDLVPEARPEDHRILRQAIAGMIWSKQFYHYDVERWLKGDRVRPPSGRRLGRNHTWPHLKAADVISMPDCWEYPWFAAWDLAFHCATFALFDIDFAKAQIELLLSERYLHPNGQIPAYEWNFGDVNPPLHAMAALKLFRAERVQRGACDMRFLKRAYHKLLLYYAWWINRKDADDNNVFEGGFLGLDNISVIDRSAPLPPGYSLKQADATGLMARFALNMTLIALEIAVEDQDYEDMAIQTYDQFLAIAASIAGHGGFGVSLWDDEDGFFKDLLVEPDGTHRRIDVYSVVGLIPLFATEVIDRRLLANAPRFAEKLELHEGGIFYGRTVTASPTWENERGERLLSIVDPTMLPRILARVLDEAQFLSSYGVRSVSRIHATDRELGTLPGVGQLVIEYVPGESTSPMFGGNSNWRGPIWLPTNYSLVEALEKFHRFLGDDYTVPVPALGNRACTLKEVATLIAERVVDLYRRDASGAIPAFRAQVPFRGDPAWRDLCLFYEYFHADTGQGLGAAHQTGWTGLIANLLMRRYRRDIPAYWTGVGGAEAAGD